MKEKILDLLKVYKTINDIKKELKINDSVRFKELVKGVNLLVDEGLVYERDNYFIASEFANIYVGKIRKNSRRQFAFVYVENLDEEVFIHQKHLKGALNDDVVQIKIVSNKTESSKAEGKVTKIISRALLVGEVYLNKRTKKILLETTELTADVINGEKFVDSICSAVIIDYKYNSRLGKDIYTVKIKERIISKFDKYSEIEPLIYKYGFNNQFTNEVLSYANSIRKFSDIDKRVDLTGKLIVTIDGSDAKDLDDAVSVEKVDSNYLLTVSIADVSYYIEEESVLDQSAYERATSVYLVDRVLPMLPKILSDDLCSLNQSDEKACLTAEMLIDKNGNIIDSKIYSSIIKSKYRLTYEDVNKYYNNSMSFNDSNLEEMLDTFKKLQSILENKRKNRGAFDFETNELNIVVDDELNVIDVNKRIRGLSEKVIEECMLLANECVAETLSKLEIPSIYRTHDSPDFEKLNNAVKVATDSGIKFKGTLTNVHDLQNFINNLNEEGFEFITNSMILRSMAKAQYTDKNNGHYGLQSNFYTHFTSPIRRYPDLIIHRLIRNFVIDKNFSSKTISKYKNYLSEASKHCSMKEQDAVDIEREVEKIYTSKYMKQFIGKKFSGKIVSITKFGFFVELDNGIEGLVHFENLDTFFEFKEYYVTDENGLKYSLGDSIIVQVTEVDLKEHKVRLKPCKLT